MPSYQDTLEKAGFDPSTAEIYLILVQNGELTVPQIQQKTALSRAAIYESLAELLAGDYLEYRKEGRRAFYKPLHPNKLFGLIEEKKRDAALLEGEMKETVASLVGAFNLAENKPGVRFFQGPDGIREITFDSLKAKDEILTYLDIDATQKYIKDMNKDYVAKRLELGIKKRMIVADTPTTRARYTKYRPNIEVRLMPAHIKPFHTSVQIYNNSISFSNLNEEKMIGVLIEDENIVQLHKSVFEFVWESLEPLF